MSASVGGSATAEEVGRACPYCRSALKSGVDIVRCGECAATHHADCWDENQGCAVVACAGGPLPGTHGDPAADKADAGKGPGSKPPPLPPERPSRRGLATGIAAALVLIVAIVAVASLSGGSDSSSGSSDDATETTTEPTTDATEGPADTSLGEEETVARIARFLERSKRGREATRNGDYDRANAIRESILSDLDSLDTQRLSGVRILLRRAMQASIKANEVRVSCPGSACAAPYDVNATQIKQRLVDAFNPFASEYLGRTYSENEV